jgi:hypothetical protein
MRRMLSAGNVHPYDPRPRRSPTSETNRAYVIASAEIMRNIAGDG